MGRPPLVYKEIVTEDVLEFIKKCKKCNITDEEIYKKIGINRMKASQWKKQYTEFYEAFKKGQAELIIDMENILYKRAIGYDVDDTEVTVRKDKDGNIKETIIKKKKKHIWSDSNLQMILRRLCPEKWSENNKIELNPNKFKEIINKMTPEELQELLNG